MSTRRKHRTVRLDGALVVVTGAGSGIGRATALAMAERGARVVSVDIDGDAAKRTAVACDEARLHGDATSSASTDGAVHEKVDVADAAAMQGLADRIEADHGPVSVVVNNAGVGLSGRFLDTTLDDWDWIVGINLLGVVHGCRAFGPAMVDRGHGHVVNVASAFAYTPRATEPAYVATKAGVLALSRSLRADWRRSGVGVSAICPGLINTPILQHSRLRGDAGAPKRVALAERLFRLGHKPEVVARSIVSAVMKNRSVVPVGAEAWFGWVVDRMAPVAVGDRMAAIDVPQFMLKRRGDAEPHKPGKG